MKIKNRQIYELVSALRDSDGYRDKKGNFVPYKYTDSTTYALSRNLRKVVDVLQDLEMTKAKKRKIFGIDVKVPDPAAVANYNAEWLDFMNQETETELTLTMVEMEDLNVGVNGTPVTVVAGLYPIIKEKV